jgi:membrane protein
LNKFQRIILSYTPIPFLLRKSKQWYLPGFEGLALYDVIQFFRKQLKQHGLAERAAAISYNFIMAIPPSMLFLFTLIPHLPFISKKAIKLQLHAVIIDIIPSPIYNKQVIHFVDGFINDSKIGLLSFGIVLSLYFASNGIMGLMRSFNKNYEGFQKRNGLTMRGIALRLTIVVFGLLFAYLILLILQGALLKLLVSNATFREIISYTRWIFIVLLVYLIIGSIYKYAPSIKERWRITSPGTILATTLSLLASLLFSLFVVNFGKYNALYGSIGTIMMIMALIYINSVALLIGFELNVSIHSLKLQALRRKIESEAVTNTEQKM